MISRSIFWVILLLGSIGAGCAAVVSDEKVGEAKSSTIPLDKIFATFDQKGVEKVVTADNRKKIRVGLEKLDREYRSGASNVFLVRAEDIETAVSATPYLAAKGTRGDKPDGWDHETSRRLWLVAYLGTAPSKPAAWSVVEVAQKGKSILLRVKKEETKGEDKHRYFVWVPLGELPEGVYSLELRIGKEAEFTRRVEVPKYE